MAMCVEGAAVVSCATFGRSPRVEGCVQLCVFDCSRVLVRLELFVAVLVAFGPGGEPIGLVASCGVPLVCRDGCIVPGESRRASRAG